MDEPSRDVSQNPGFPFSNIENVQNCLQLTNKIEIKRNVIDWDSLLVILENVYAIAADISKGFRPSVLSCNFVLCFQVVCVDLVVVSDPEGWLVRSNQSEW